MDGCADVHAVASTQLVDPRRPAFDVPVGERALHSLERPAIQAAAQIARVEQGDADALRPRGLDERLAEVVAVAMEVVELADRGDARVQHLAEDGARVGRVARTVPALRRVEHLAPPFPEVAAASLGATAQRFLEHVAVDVGKAWERESFQLHRARGLRRVFGYGLDPAALDLDQHVGGDVPQPCLLSVPDSGSPHVAPAFIRASGYGRLARSQPRARARSPRRHAA